ncbi:MAG TPA: DUF456 domain-containing protein [Phycisphaerae bacterium]|nr:DUF456 domain-containing protein [Phycisphaerae bacterium]
MEIAALGMLTVVALLGVALAAFQLPGTWLILAAAAGYDWYFDWQRFGWKWLIGLLIFAGLAEVVDTLAAVVAAKRAGASRRAAIGAVIGGFVGMILISVPIPIPVVGAVIGGLMGCFLGALLAELSLNKDIATGARVGLFATIGKIFGLVAKTSAAAVIAGTVISLAAWSTFWPANTL